MSDTSKKQAVREYMLVAYVWEKKSYQEMYQIVINSLPMRAGVAPVVLIEQRLEHLATILGTEEEKAERNEDTAAAVIVRLATLPPESIRAHPSLTIYRDRYDALPPQTQQPQ